MDLSNRDEAGETETAYSEYNVQVDLLSVSS